MKVKVVSLILGVSFLASVLVIIKPLQAQAIDCDPTLSPCAPANTRILVVAQDGSGNFIDLQSALTAAKAGDTIQVKDGVYKGPSTPPCAGVAAGAFCIIAHGTQQQPIAITPFPGHKPKLASEMFIYGSWILFEGLESADADHGFRFYFYEEPGYREKARNLTFRGLYIRNASYMGIFGFQPRNILFEDNTLEKNGLGPKNCTTPDGWGGHTQAGYGYVHCHGIYLGQHPSYPGPSGVIVRRNKFIGNAGSGFQTRMDGQRSSGYVIENNLFINNQRAMNLSTLTDSLVRNNTIILTDYPRPNRAEKSCAFLHAIYLTKFLNNLCYIHLPQSEIVWTFHGHDADDPPRMIWSNNAIFTSHKGIWVWGGQNKNDFANTWKVASGDEAGITGYVTNGDGSEAGFVSMSDLRLREDSPLKGKGAHCPATDIDGRPRVGCNIGAY